MTGTTPGFVALSAGRVAGAALVGMAVGLWVEIYRGHLRALRPRGAALVALDLLFWVVATGVVAFGLYYANWLDVRLYAVAAMAAGALWASWLAGPVVRPASAAATRGVIWSAHVAGAPWRAAARTLASMAGAWRARRPPRPVPVAPIDAIDTQITVADDPLVAVAPRRRRRRHRWPTGGW